MNNEVLICRKLYIFLNVTTKLALVSCILCREHHLKIKHVKWSWFDEREILCYSFKIPMWNHRGEGEGILLSTVKHPNVHSHALLRVHTMEVNRSSLPVSNGASGLALFPGLPTVQHIWGLLLQRHKLDSGKAWEWDCWTENESNHFNEPMLTQETPPTYGQRGLGVNL